MTSFSKIPSFSLMLFSQKRWSGPTAFSWKTITKNMCKNIMSLAIKNKLEHLAKFYLIIGKIFQKIRKIFIFKKVKMIWRDIISSARSWLQMDISFLKMVQKALIILKRRKNKNRNKYFPRWQKKRPHLLKVLKAILTQKLNYSIKLELKKMQINPHKMITDHFKKEWN